jgi:nitrogen fixation protein NifU and related proteins
MYSERLLSLFHERRHGGRLAGATHEGASGIPGKGPYTWIWLRVCDGIVAEARWKSMGCVAAMACAEAVCRWSEGRLLTEVAQVDAAKVMESVGGVPEEKGHCPVLAANAMQAAAGLKDNPSDGSPPRAV